MNHMAVWMDHHEAHIFHVDPDRLDERTVDWPPQHIHRHEKQEREHQHPDDEHRFFREVARLLANAGQILVLGPSMTKLHFIKFAHEHDRPLSERIVGVETASHPTDKQILAHARAYFHVAALRTGLAPPAV